MTDRYVLIHEYMYLLIKAYADDTVLGTMDTIQL